MPKKKSKDAANLEAHQGAESKAEANISSQSNESSESNSDLLPDGSEILKHSDSDDFQNQEIEVPEENSSLQVKKEKAEIPQEEEKQSVIENAEIPQEEEKQSVIEKPEIPQEEEKQSVIEKPEIPQEEEKQSVIEKPEIPQEEEKQSVIENAEINKKEEEQSVIEKPEINKEEEKQPVIEKPEITKAKEFLAEPSNTLKTRLSSLFQRAWQVLPILSIGLAAAVGAGLYFLRRSNQFILAGIASTMLFSEIVRRWFNNRQEGSTNDECKANINPQANASKKDLPMDSVEGSPSYLPLHSKEGSPDASASSSVVSSSKGITPGC